MAWLTSCHGTRLLKLMSLASLIYSSRSGSTISRKSVDIPLKCRLQHSRISQNRPKHDMLHGPRQHTLGGEGVVILITHARRIPNHLANHASQAISNHIKPLNHTAARKIPPTESMMRSYLATFFSARSVAARPASAEEEGDERRAVTASGSVTATSIPKCRPGATK